MAQVATAKIYLDIALLDASDNKGFSATLCLSWGHCSELPEGFVVSAFSQFFDPNFYLLVRYPGLTQTNTICGLQAVERLDCITTSARPLGNQRANTQQLVSRKGRNLNLKNITKNKICLFLYTLSNTSIAIPADY